MTRTLSATKLVALADLSTILPRLTTTELRRLLVLAQAMRKERDGHYRASTLAEEVKPVLDVVVTLSEHLSSLDEVLSAAVQLAALGEDEALSIDESDKADLRASSKRVAACIDALIAIDGQALSVLCRAVDGAVSEQPT